MKLLAALLSVLASGCAAHDMPPIWFRPMPTDWVVPQRFAACTARGEDVWENGQPNGLATIRLECADRLVWLDKRTKRVVHEVRW